MTTWTKEYEVESRKQKIENAKSAGVHRPETIKASNQQLLTYTLHENWTFHHATLESASLERYFLQAALGKRIRIMKVWNVKPNRPESPQFHLHL